MPDNDMCSQNQWNECNAPGIVNQNNSVNHPTHYNWIEGIECLDVVKNFDFVIGNVIKYCWRAGFKASSSKLEDLEKARYYIDSAINDERINQQKNK